MDPHTWVVTLVCCPAENGDPAWGRVSVAVAGPERTYWTDDYEHDGSGGTDDVLKGWTSFVDYVAGLVASTALSPDQWLVALSQGCTYDDRGSE